MTNGSDNQLKSQFLRTMSHELRMPLTTILGIAQIMKTKQLSPTEIKDYSNTLFESGLDLLTLINDIFDFSRSETVALKISPVMMNLQHVIEQIIKKINHKAQAKNIKLVLDYDSKLPAEIHGDPQRIRQVLMNLIDNAIKFTDQGHVLIKVQIDNNENNDSFSIAKIFVIDTGIGMDPEQVKNIFNQTLPINPFSNDPNINKSFGLGLELRLGLVKKIVELMGGKIEVQSTLNQGSHFSFSLPLLQSATKNNLENNLHLLNNIRILLIDDNEVSTQLLEHECKSAFMQCTKISTSNVMKSIKETTTSTKPYQIMMISAQTFDHHIAYLCRIIRANNYFKNTILTLALSSQPHDYETEQAIATGFNAVFNSLDPIRLVQQLANFCADLETRPKEQLQSVTKENKHKILLVEDNHLNQKVARLMLENLGCVIDIAHDGAAALELLEQKNYDLIFMDLGLPDMSGLEVAAEIRRREKQNYYKHPRIPIIALTAYVHEEAQQASVEAGIDDYIAKPLLQDRLKNIVIHWTSKDKSEVT